MSVENIVMGPQAKVQINGDTFDYTDGEAAIERKDHDVNDSSEADWDQSKPGRRKLTASISAQSATDVELHGSELQIMVDDVEYVDFKLFPWGLDESPYHSADFQVTRFRFTAPAKSGDPCMVHIEGHSHGPVTLP